MSKIALLGFGVVGSGVAEVLTKNKSIIEIKTGCEVDLKYILDLRDFPDSPFGSLVIHNIDLILKDPEITIVAEMMGGSHPAYEFSKACLEAGKSVVTSNKEVVANFGKELLDIAHKNNVAYMFEASVGGGIPIIRPMCNDLSSNKITKVCGILNGTTNYILTKMVNEGADFDSVLKDAQKKGYAEANPAADVEGTDAARKTVILGALASGISVNPSDIHVEGINDITTADVELASGIGYAIKLIGYAEVINGKLLCMVSPRLVHETNPLYGVNGVFNGILVSGDMVGEVMFYGPGAGKLPTASAVCGDIIDIASHKEEDIAIPQWKVADSDDIADFGTYSCRRLFVGVPAIDDAEIVASGFDGNHAWCICDGVDENRTEALLKDTDIKKSYRIL